LFIRARSGQEVRSVATGEVVFSDWLRGFGNLLIVDHGGGYLSLYSNNESLYKQAGTRVRAGDAVASVGNTGGQEEPGLYFELRHLGKPFDPMTWVPRDRQRMYAKMKQVGLIGVGIMVGAALTLNYSAVAERDPEPLPIEDLRAFTEIFGKIKNDYVEPVEDKKLITEAINGMLSGLDPHSAYLDGEAYKELQVGTQGEFGGLGIEVGMEDGFVKVVSPIEDTPAYKAGLKTGDLIIKLDETPVKGMTLNDAVKRMRGKVGTDITLTLMRKGEAKPLTMTITRAVIKIKSVKHKLVEPDYGYVRITQFQEHSGENLVAALNDLEDKNGGTIKGLVLDLRNDPGGLLNTAVGVSGAFLKPNELVVYTDGRTEDAKMRLTNAREHYLRPGESDYLKKLPAWARNGAYGRSGQRRLRVSLGNRCRRLAGPQARTGSRHPIIRQGFGADHPAAEQRHGNQAHHGALLHTRRTQHPGQGNHARSGDRGRHGQPERRRKARRPRS
jgi:C-terminal peptidase prc